MIRRCGQSEALIYRADLWHGGTFEGDRWRRAAALEPGCLDHRTGLAASLERAGRPLEAAAELEKAGEHIPMLRSDREALDALLSAAARLRGGGETAPRSSRASSRPVCLAGRRAYSPEEVLFRFMHVSDLHIGQWMDGGSNDTDRLSWITDIAYPALKPAFIAASGDLTDSTNGFIMPLFGPYQKEWSAYAALVSGLPRGVWRDLPGNHDHYSDKHFDYYLANSVSRSLQYSWTVKSGGRIWQFIAVNTAASDGRPWPHDERGLDEGELDWLEMEILPGAAGVFIFGHHPVYRLKYGRERFERILKENNISYFFGHSHESYIALTGGRMEVQVDSLGKGSENNYALAVVLRDGGVCVSLHDSGRLP